MLRVLDDSTVVDEQGRYRFLSEKTFCELTRVGDRCFVCLTAAGDETQEHIIPNWIIRYCNLEKHTIRLGNGEKVTHPKYKVPCCERCNQSLRRTYEDSISSAIKGGISSIFNLHRLDPTILLRWLNLLFFKTHYKDLFLRRNLDRRLGEEKIADVYDWGVMNLPHSLFRAPLFDITIETPNIGSLTVVKVLNQDWAGLWDYRDDFLSRTVYVRIRDVVLIAVLHDGGITSHLMKDRFCVENGAYVAQTLEMLTDYQSFTYWLRTMPDYVMRWREGIDYTGLRVDLPTDINFEPNVKKRHDLLWRHLERYADLPMDNGHRLGAFKDELLAGRRSLALKPRPVRMATAQEILGSLRTANDPAIFYGV